MARALERGGDPRAVFGVRPLWAVEAHEFGGDIAPQCAPGGDVLTLQSLHILEKAAAPHWSNAFGNVVKSHIGFYQPGRRLDAEFRNVIR